MKTRRQFLKTAFAGGVAAAIPIKSPAPATLYEAGAALCLVLTVTAAGVICVVRLCRPRYILYFSVDEDKKTNGGRTYVCLSCSRAEAERQNLTSCEGKFTSLAECQAKAAKANTNYLDIACGPIATEPTLRASITLETTATPDIASSWQAVGISQTMDLNADDPQVSWTLPQQTGSAYFRTSAVSL